MTLALCCLIAMTEAVKMYTSAGSRAPNDKDRANFSDFEAQFSKHYRTTAEHDMRLQIFVDNEHKVANLNANRSRRANYKIN